MLGVLFKILYWIGGNELLILGSLILAVYFAVVLIGNLNKDQQTNRLIKLIGVGAMIVGGMGEAFNFFDGGFSLVIIGISILVIGMLMTRSEQVDANHLADKIDEIGR